MPSEIAISHMTLDFCGQVDDGDLSDECKKEARRCGIIAWGIALDLRKFYQLPSFDPGWDIVDTLTGKPPERDEGGQS